MKSNGKVVMITGASSGIGKALAIEFAKNNFTVIGNGRDKSKLKELESNGIHTVEFDITNYSQTEKELDNIILEFNGIDILINNAGYGLMAPIIDVTRDQFLTQLEVNLFAQLELTRKIVPVMKEKGNGLIINIGSVSGIVTTPFSGAYCASKAAFHAVSDALRMELSPFGINVITIKPGGVASQFGARAAKESEKIEISKSYQSIKDDILLRAESSQIGAMTADKFAHKIVKIVKSGKTPAEIYLGRMSFLLPFMKRVFSIKILDNILKKRFGLDKLNELSS